jgi:disulfide bond formation protein DsbB
MDFKKIFKIIAVIVAIAGLATAAYVAIKKLTAKEEPEYFDDNDFFECDNDLEIIEVKEEEAEVEEKAEEPKAAPKKKAAKKKAE